MLDDSPILQHKGHSSPGETGRVDDEGQVEAPQLVRGEGSTWKIIVITRSITLKTVHPRQLNYVTVDKLNTVRVD